MRVNALFLFVFMVFCGGASYAQTLTTVQDLQFGQAIVTNNNARHSAIVNTDGSLSVDPEFIFITQPQVGIYRLVGGLPNQAIDDIDLTVDDRFRGPGPDFRFNRLRSSAPSNLDINGEADIFVGGRIQTSGNGRAYRSSETFNGLFTITVTLN